MTSDWYEKARPTICSIFPGQRNPGCVRKLEEYKSDKESISNILRGFYSSTACGPTLTLPHRLWHTTVSQINFTPQVVFGSAVCHSNREQARRSFNNRVTCHPPNGVYWVMTSGGPVVNMWKLHLTTLSPYIQLQSQPTDAGKMAQWSGTLPGFV